MTISGFRKLKERLKQYTNTDRQNIGIDTDVAVVVMLEKLEILRDMMMAMIIRKYMGNSQVERMRTIVGGMDFYTGKKEEEQKEFKKTALELGKAHALCAATDKGKEKALKLAILKQ